VSAAEIINRIRPKLNRMPVASAFLQASQDLRIGGRGSNAMYQYTIQSDNIDDLKTWGPKLFAEMKRLPGLQDVNSDQQNGGLDEVVTFDRVTAAKLGQTAPIAGRGTLLGVRPVRSFADLYATESVLRRPRSCTAVLGDAGWPQGHLFSQRLCKQCHGKW